MGRRERSLVPSRTDDPPCTKPVRIGLMARVDYDKQSAVYDKGRTLPPEAIAQWMVTARRHAGDGVQRILDLGCGTARFSAALADAFDADVVGLEPSSGMLAQAATKPE